MLEKEVVITENAPSYGSIASQAIKYGNFVFVSGQVSLTKTGEIAETDIKTQTKQALENTKAILEAVGTSLGNAVKVTVFLTNISRDYSGMNEVYTEYFKKKPPARSTVEVSRLAKDEWVVEIETIAAMST